MNLKSFLINGAIVLVFTILGYGASKLLGNVLFGESDPSWSNYLLPIPPKKVVGIVYLQLSSAVEDPTGDSLFVKGENGEFYSYTLFQNDWLPVSEDPTRWKNIYVSKCAKEWLGASEFSNLNEYPPIENNVIDSMGVYWFNAQSIWFSAPLISVARCYTLLEDGSIQAWTYSGVVEDLIKNRSLKKWFMIVGVVIGLVLSFFVIRYRTIKVEPAKT